MVESDSPENPGRVQRALTEMLKRGAFMALDIKTDDPDHKKNKLRQLWEDRKKAFGERLKTASISAIEDKEIQDQGAEYFSATIKEGVQGIKDNFKQTIDTAATWIKPEKEDNRPMVTQVRDMLGYKDTDAWYTKLAKNAGARAITWSLPIAGYVAAKVTAHEITGKPEEERSYRESFTTLFKNLIGRLVPPQEPVVANP